MTWRQSFAPLRERSFAWYFCSRLVSTLGSMMASIALAFAVLDITSSASALGQVLTARTIPMVLLLLFGGVVADRLPRALVLQASNLLAALTQGTVAVLVLTGAANLPLLIALEAVNGVVSAMSFPAMASMVPQLVPRGELQSANVLLSMVRGGLTVLAPTLGALLVVTVGSGWALGVDAASYVLSALFLLGVRIPPRPPAAEGSSVVRDLREGWDFFAGTTWLWVIVLAFGFLNAIHAGAWFTLGPPVAKATIGVQGWGVLFSAESAGLLVMTVVLLRVRLQRPLVVGMLGCAFMGLPILLLGVAPHLPVLIVATFVAGAGIQVFDLGWNLAMQENVDDAMLSRAYSYDSLGSFVAMPLGQLVYGPLGEAFGYRDVLLVSGVLYGVIALLALAPRSVRTLQRRTTAETTLEA